MHFWKAIEYFLNHSTQTRLIDYSDVTTRADKHLSSIIIWTIIVSCAETFVTNPLILLQEQSHLLIHASYQLHSHSIPLDINSSDPFTWLINCNIGFWLPTVQALQSSVTHFSDYSFCHRNLFLALVIFQPKWSVYSTIVCKIMSIVKDHRILGT